MGTKLQATVVELAELKIIAEQMAAALAWYTNPEHYSEDSWGVRAVIDPPDYGKIGTTGWDALVAYRAWEAKR